MGRGCSNPADERRGAASAAAAVAIAALLLLMRLALQLLAPPHGHMPPNSQSMHFSRSSPTSSRGGFGYSTALMA